LSLRVLDLKATEIQKIQAKKLIEGLKTELVLTALRAFWLRNAADVDLNQLEN
jgi:hypothetical protein